MTRAEGGDPAQLGSAWTAFETELLRHMDLEEVELMPAFMEHDPDEARALLDEHAALRAALNEIGMTLQLHCLRVEAVADFARRLKAHAAREDAALYAWAQAHVARSAWDTIKRGLRQVARLRTSFSRVANSYM
jgi:hemerythrin-like domain-containing protein